MYNFQQMHPRKAHVSTPKWMSFSEQITWYTAEIAHGDAHGAKNTEHQRTGGNTIIQIQIQERKQKESNGGVIPEHI